MLGLDKALSGNVKLLIYISIRARKTRQFVRTDSNCSDKFQLGSGKEYQFHPSPKKD